MNDPYNSNPLDFAIDLRNHLVASVADIGALVNRLRASPIAMNDPHFGPLLRQYVSTPDRISWRDFDRAATYHFDPTFHEGRFMKLFVYPEILNFLTSKYLQLDDEIKQGFLFENNNTPQYICRHSTRSCQWIVNPINSSVKNNDQKSWCFDFAIIPPFNYRIVGEAKISVNQKDNNATQSMNKAIQEACGWLNIDTITDHGEKMRFTHAIAILITNSNNVVEEWTDNCVKEYFNANRIFPLIISVPKKELDK